MWDHSHYLALIFKHARRLVKEWELIIQVWTSGDVMKPTPVWCGTSLSLPDKITPKPLSVRNCLLQLIWVSVMQRISILYRIMARVRQSNFSSLNPSTFHVAMQREALHVWAKRKRSKTRSSGEYGETSLSTCRWHPYLPAPLPTFRSRIDCWQSVISFCKAGSANRAAHWPTKVISSC